MRREFTRKIMSAAIKRAGGKCEKCSAALKPREAEVDHILPDILGGEPVLANAQVLCKPCHKEKSADDIRRARKADRQGDKAIGAVRPSSALSRKDPKAPKPQRHPALPPRQMFAPTEIDLP